MEYLIYKFYFINLFINLIHLIKLTLHGIYIFS